MASGLAVLSKPASLGDALPCKGYRAFFLLYRSCAHRVTALECVRAKEMLHELQNGRMQQLDLMQHRINNSQQIGDSYVMISQ